MLWYGLAMQTRSRPKSKHEAPVARNNRAATNAVDSLRTNENMAALMPAVMRMAAIQRDCAAALSGMFGSCAVLRFDSGQLVLATANAAMAARLKQQLPNLQDSLCTSGWEVSAIRLKVQPAKNHLESRRSSKQDLPPQALDAFAALEKSLDKTHSSEALRAAINAMMERRR